MTTTLYRCPTPTNRLCPCGRVERELRRGGVAHEVVRVPYAKGRRPEVVRLSGQRHVPLLVIDGEPICDSRRIVEHLRWRAEQPRAAPERAGR
jgi:glutathione S-transferase